MLWNAEYMADFINEHFICGMHANSQQYFIDTNMEMGSHIRSTYISAFVFSVAFRMKFVSADFVYISMGKFDHKTYIDKLTCLIIITFNLSFRFIVDILVLFSSNFITFIYSIGVDG